MEDRSSCVQPLVMVTSLPPHPSRVSHFAEEALEFIHKRLPDYPLKVVTHTMVPAHRGRYYDVLPVIDPAKPQWYEEAAAVIRSLKPSVVHIQHDCPLYEHVDCSGRRDVNAGFLELLRRISDLPTVVEMHSVHGRLREVEQRLILAVAESCQILMFKCDFLKWRLEWSLSQQGISPPPNITVIPPGVRPDRRFAAKEIDEIKRSLGLDDLAGKHLAGMVGWVQNNKRWDILTNVWPEVHEQILQRTGQDWILFAAGDVLSQEHRPDFDYYTAEIRKLENIGLARFFQFKPQGTLYYRVLAICDFVILPTLDETQSGTLSRIIALNKPYITTAPVEGLTAQTVESDGGLLFTNRATLKRGIIKLATSEGLRFKLGENLKRYLDERVSWDLVANQYAKAYELAQYAVESEHPIVFPQEFKPESATTHFQAPRDVFV